MTRKIKFNFYSSDLVFDDFIYNRFDLQGKNVDGVIELSDNDSTKNIQYHIEEKTICLGCWHIALNKQELKIIINRLFKMYTYINCINIGASKNKTGYWIKKSYYHLILPSRKEELIGLIKKRHPREKSKKRKLETQFGQCQLINYKVDNCPSEIMDFYYINKNETKGVKYNLNHKEYFRKYHVSDVYALYFGSQLVSVILSCEQCAKVYFENLTYDKQLSNFSPGTLIYFEYLLALYDKGLFYIDLGGGDYGYKKYFNSICETEYYCIFYRNVFKNIYLNFKKTIKSFLRRK